jgi:hypothetical protein
LCCSRPYGGEKLGTKKTVVFLAVAFTEKKALWDKDSSQNRNFLFKCAH